MEVSLEKNDLKRYFNICKKYNKNDINDMLSLIENGDLITNKYDMNYIDVESLNKLENFFGGSSKQKLGDIYDEYYERKGGFFGFGRKKKKKGRKRKSRKRKL